MSGSYTVFTDGACRGNPGAGGWGALIRDADGHEQEVSGGSAYTTNNRMELTAAVMALETLPPGSRVTLWTDSRYVRDGISFWIKNWRRNNWRTSSRKSVKNGDLWQRLDAIAAQHEIDWQWLRGHAGHYGNERADALAQSGIGKL